MLGQRQARSLRLQRVAAAFLAVALRALAGSFLALALPPFSPPLRRASCAAVGLAGFTFSASPVAMSTTSLARTFGSRGRAGRLGTATPLDRDGAELVGSCLGAPA